MSSRRRSARPIEQAVDLPDVELIKNKPTLELATLRFEGPRFLGPAVEMESAHEIIIYGLLVLECARGLWVQRNKRSAHMPERFRTGFCLQVGSADSNSTVIPVRRVCTAEPDAPAASGRDEFDDAAALIDALIFAVRQGHPFPPTYPPEAIPIFSMFGKSLREGETIFIRSRSSSLEVPFDLRTRDALMRRIAYPDMRARPRNGSDPRAARVWDALAEIGASAPRGNWDDPPGKFAPRKDKLH